MSQSTINIVKVFAIYYSYSWFLWLVFCVKSYDSPVAVTFEVWIAVSKWTVLLLMLKLGSNQRQR